MSVSEKLSKVLDSSKDLFDEINQTDSQPPRSKKDQISKCHTIVDLVCNPSFRNEMIKNPTEFHRLLGLSMELLLRSCEHEDSDIRLVADACLNRLIKGLMDSAIARVILELFREMRRNGSSRTLRAATSRFADLCHLIRLQKCRTFAQNLIPVLGKMMARDEEAVQECLSASIGKLAPVFGAFMSDKEVISLLRVPLGRLCSSSATVRRMAASVVATICQHCRKPKHFCAFLLSRLMGMVFSTSTVEPATYLGVLLSLRHLLSPSLLGSSEDTVAGSSESSLPSVILVHDRGRPKEMNVSKSQLVQVVGLLLHCSQHQDHNVVTAALETLHQLLRQPPPLLLSWLLSASPRAQPSPDSGLSLDIGSQLASSCRHTAQFMFNAGDVDTDSGADVLSSLGSASLNSSMVDDLDDDSKMDDSLDDSILVDRDTSPLDSLPSTLRPHSVSATSSGASTPALQGEGLPPVPCWPWQLEAEERLRIPVIYTLNLLCSSFLLEGRAHGLLGDRLVRVSVKSLALSCFGAAINLCPQAIFGHVRPLAVFAKSPSVTSIKSIEEKSADFAALEEEQLVRDVLLFSTHNDPQLRGNTAGIVGSLVKSALAIGRGDFRVWSQQASAEWKTAPIELESLLELLTKALRDSSSVTSRMACLAVKHCLHALLSSQQALKALELVLVLLQLKSNTYWLVKAELLDIVCQLDYKLLFFLQTIYQQQPGKDFRMCPLDVQAQVLYNVVLPLLGDDDSRVQGAAAQALVELVLQLYFPRDYSKQDVLTTLAQQHSERLWRFRQPLFKEASFSSQQNNIENILLKEQEHSVDTVMPMAVLANLSRILVAISQILLPATSRSLQVGCCVALRELCLAFPVHKYPTAWCGIVCKARRPRRPAPAPSQPPEKASVPTSTSSQLPVQGETASSSATNSSKNEKDGPSKVAKILGSSSFMNAKGLSTGDQPSRMAGLVGKGRMTLFSFVGRGKSSAAATTSAESATAVPSSDVSEAMSHSAETSFSSKHATTPMSNGTNDNSSQSAYHAGPLPLLIALFTSTSLAHDLIAHQNAIEVCGRLLHGQVTQRLAQTAPTTPEGSSSRRSSKTTVDLNRPWPAIQHRPLVPIARELLQHLVRLLNISCHIIDGKDLPPLFSREAAKSQGKDQLPPPSTSSVVVGNASPSKKPQSTASPGRGGGGGGLPARPGTPSKGSTSKVSLSTPDVEVEFVADSKHHQTLGGFYHLPHYRKLFDVLRGAYQNFKTTVDSSAVDKFGNFTQAILQMFGLLMEVTAYSDINKHCEEVLGYLGSIMQCEPGTTVLCVQQLFRVMFDANSVHYLPMARSAPAGVTSHSRSMFLSCLELPRQATVSGLLTSRQVASDARTYLEQRRAKRLQLQEQRDQPDGKSSPSLQPKKQQRRLPPLPKYNMSNISSHLSHFEPIVINALGIYITTQSVHLQQRILSLLAQLVNLRVNYSLLDTDQKFVTFVMKQLSIIEVGQLRDAGLIIPAMFNFLVLLTYERHNVKAIIDLPQIIQLCDGIMASSNTAAIHAIVALEAIIYDLFVIQPAGSPDELVDNETDTQREVVVSMLLRLVQHYQVLRLLVTVLRNSRPQPVKWHQRSQMLTAMLLSRIAKQQMDIDDMGIVTLLHHVFGLMAPSAIEAAPLIKLLLTPTNLQVVSQDGVVVFYRWVAMVLVLLRLLFVHFTEAELLVELNKLGTVPEPFWPAPREYSFDTSSKDKPAELFVLFLLSVTCRLFHTLANAHELHISIKHGLFASQLLGQLLHFLQQLLGGPMTEISGTAQRLIHSGCSVVDRINQLSLQLAREEPLLVLAWAHLLVISGFDHWVFWQYLLEGGGSHTNIEHDSNEALQTSFHQQQSPCANVSLLQNGAVVLFSQLVLSHGSQETLIFLKRHCTALVKLSWEPPVQQLIQQVQTSQQMGSVFLSVLTDQAHKWLEKVQWQHSLIQFLSVVHLGCLNKLLHFLLCCLLPSRHLLPSFRQPVVTVALRHLEQGLECGDEQIASLLSSEQVDALLHAVQSCSQRAKVDSLVRKLHCVQALVAGRSAVADSVAELRPHLSLASTDTEKKAFYMALIKKICHSSELQCLPRRCATMMLPLDLNEINTVIHHKDFNLALLEDFVAVGIRQTLLTLLNRHTITPMEEFGSPLHNDVMADTLEESEMNRLLHASLSFLLDQLQRTVDSSATCHNSSELNSMCHLSSALVCFLQHASLLPKKGLQFAVEKKQAILDFAGKLIDRVWSCFQKGSMPPPRAIVLSLSSLNAVLENEWLFAAANGSSRSSWVCHVIKRLHQVLAAVTLPLGTHLPVAFKTSEDVSSSTAGQDAGHVECSLAREQASNLMLALKTHLTPAALSLGSLSGCQHVAPFLIKAFRTCITNVCRLAAVNSYARTPPLAWQLGWADAVALTADQNTLPPLPVDLLREKDLLHDYIWRANCLGWTCRHQFEETWVSLLTTLDLGTQAEQLPPEEELERVQVSCRAVQGIVSLLLDTMRTPMPGHVTTSEHSHQPRQQELPFLGSRAGKRLSDVCRAVDRRLHFLNADKYDKAMSPLVQLTSSSHHGFSWMSNQRINVLQPNRPAMFTRNLDRPLGFKGYGFGQYSVNFLTLQVVSADIRLDNTIRDEYDVVTDGDNHLSASSSGVPDTPTEADDWNKRPSSVGPIPMEAIDINSCVQLLQELFSRWLEASPTQQTPPFLVLQTVRAATMMSDLFVEARHFQWLIQIFGEMLPTTTSNVEDELLLQYLVIGLCRAAAVCHSDGAVADRVTRAIEMAIHSSLASTQVCALQASLYILEVRFGADIKQVLALLTEYVSTHLIGKQSVGQYSQQHLLSMWAVALTIIERYSHELKDTAFTPKLVQAAISVVLEEEETVSTAVHHCILHGLQRLLLSFSLAKAETTAAMQLAVRRLNMPNSQCAASALTLLLTCMYTGKGVDRLLGFSADLDESEDDSTATTDSALMSLEKVTILFDRIRKGFPLDAQVVAAVLPALLEDFVVTALAMNKMVGEFMSSHQPHPTLLALIMAKAFDTLRRRSQLTDIRDWVILSVGSFIQRRPVAVAVWSLCCLFISASSSVWIRSLLPYLLGRFGNLSTRDEETFFLTAVDFFTTHNLLQEQKEIFLETFHKHSTETRIYPELLQLLGKTQD